MENLTPKQHRNILKIAKFLDNKESALVESFIELDDKLEMLDEKIETVTENLKKKLDEELIYEVDEQKIADNVLSKIPVPKNGEDYVLTEGDKEDIASKITVPVVVKEVETIIEKVEVIKEIPIVTENVVEKAVTDTAEVTIEKINKSESKISVERIEGSFVSQETYTDEIKTLQNRTQLLAQIASSARDRVIPSASPGGSDTQVQFNDSGAFGGDAGLTFNKTTGRVGIGTTSPSSKLDVTTDGLVLTQTNDAGISLVNTTVATAGVPRQISPALRLRGHAWKTEETASSQSIDWQIYCHPNQGAEDISLSELQIQSSIDGIVPYTVRFALSAGSGFLQLTGGLGISGAFSGASTGAFSGAVTTSRILTTTPTTGFSALATTSASSGVPVRISPSMLWTGRAWDTITASSKTNDIEAYLLPATGAVTSGALVFANRTVNGSANSNEIMRLTTNGTIVANGAILEKVVTLTDGATVSLDASLGNVFNLTAEGDRTILAPTNPTDGQTIRIKILASGANRTITLTTGAGAFVFSTYVTSPLPAIPSGKVMSLVCDYSSLNSLWTVLAENTDV